jgi:hypothetical protein
MAGASGFIEAVASREGTCRLTCVFPTFCDVEVVCEPGGWVFEGGCVEEEDDVVEAAVLCCHD